MATATFYKKHRELSSVLSDDREGWVGERDVQEGGDLCICKPDLLLCTAETNKTLQSNYTLKFFKQWNKICYLYNKIMRPWLWKCFIILQSFIKERPSPTDRIYITTVQFSLPQQSKDWSTVKTIYRWNFRGSTWRRITFYSGRSTSQGMCNGVSPYEPTISLKFSYKCFMLPHLSFTKWHLETLHALMSLKLSCLPAQPLAPCIKEACSFLELLLSSQSSGY